MCNFSPHSLSSWIGSVSPRLQGGGPGRCSGAVGGGAQGRVGAAPWGSAQLGPSGDFPRSCSGRHPPRAGPQNLRAASEQSVLQEFRPAVHCGARHTASHSPTGRLTPWSRRLCGPLTQLPLIPQLLPRSTPLFPSCSPLAFPGPQPVRARGQLPGARLGTVTARASFLNIASAGPPPLWP